MRSTNSQNLSIQIVIPTCYGGASLLPAIQSIFKSAEGVNFSLLVTADSVPIAPKYKKELKRLGVKLVENSKPGSQQKKLNQMITQCRSDLVITTQDDVRFEYGALRKIREAFSKQPTLTMAGVRIEPEPAMTRMAQIIQVGVRIQQAITLQWNGGDNYLAANGRCLCFRTAFVKQFKMPEWVVNGDAGYYFENQQHGGVFSYLPNVVVYNQSPGRLQEHLRQTKRFQYSCQELSRLYPKRLKNAYMIPKDIAFLVLFSSLLKHPILTMAYVCINLYSKIVYTQRSQIRNPLWSMDVTTKLQ